MFTICHLFVDAFVTPASTMRLIAYPNPKTVSGRAESMRMEKLPE
jgi:hypothetical protein